MKRKFVSRALPSALIAGGLLVAGGMSATAADESGASSTEQSTGGLGGALTGTVDAVLGDDGAVDSTLDQVTDTVGQVTKKDGALDDTVQGVTGAVDSVAGEDGAVDDVVQGVTRSAAAEPAAEPDAGPVAADRGPVEDVVGGVTGVLNAVAGENGAVDDVLGADRPERGLTDDLPAELIDDVGSIGENVGRGDLPGTIGAVAGPDGVVDDLLESPSSGGPGGGPGGGGSGDGGSDDGDGDWGGGGSGDGSGGGTIPVVNPGGGFDLGGLLPVSPISDLPGALAQTGGQVGAAVGAGLALTAAGAAMIRARRRILEVQG
jgi:hypothetical protein